MRWTRGTIIDQALQRVGNTSVSVLQAARVRLNRILQDLHQQWDWPFLWTYTAPDLTITTAGTIELPRDFLKPEDTEALTLTAVGGVPTWRVLPEVDHRTFYARNPQARSAAPTLWTLEYATWNLASEPYPSPQKVPVGHAWPLPTAPCTAHLRYKWLPSDLSTADPVSYDADIPVFPYDSLLSELLFEWAQSYEVDPRRAESLQVNTLLVERVRGAAFPARSYPSQVPLDPQFFGPAWRGD
jgi:hypothetical protein